MHLSIPSLTGEDCSLPMTSATTGPYVDDGRGGGKFGAIFGAIFTVVIVVIFIISTIFLRRRYKVLKSEREIHYIANSESGGE